MKIFRKFTFTFAAGALPERFPRRRGRISRPSAGSAHALTPGLRRPAGAASLTRFRLLGLPRLGAAAAGLLAAAFVLLLGAGAAQAQTSMTLVNNTGQSSDATTRIGLNRAQAFTTGSHSAGYTLTSVDVQTVGTVNAGQVTMRIMSSNASNRPGDSLGTLTLGTPMSSLATFTSSGIDLDPNTTYFVDWESSSGTTSTEYRRTNSDNEDSDSATGWSIGNGSVYRDTSSQAWQTSSTSMKMEIHGYEKPSPVQEEPPSAPGRFDGNARFGGSTLTMEFKQPLDESSVPAGSAFELTTRYGRHLSKYRDCRNGCTFRGTGKARISGNTVTVTLDWAIPWGPAASLVYTPPSENPLRTASGTDVASFTDRVIGNRGDRTPPALLDVSVWSGATSVGGSNLRLTFDELLDPHWVPDEGDFHVSVNGERRRVSVVYIHRFNPTIVGIHFDGLVRSADRVTLGYTRSSYELWAHNGPLVDIAGNFVENFSDVPVNNREGPPVFVNAEVDGKRLTATFNEPLDRASVPARGDFHVTVGSARRNVASGGVAIDGATVTLTLASAVSEDDSVKLRYTSGANPLRDAGGAPVETFPDQAVTNTSEPPAFVGAEVNGKTLTLTFDETLDGTSVPAPGDFHVTAGTSRRNVAGGGVAIDGATVRLTLASAVAYGETGVKVRYTRDANPLRDLGGNAVASFSDRTVTNVRPPSFQRAQVDGETLTLTFDESLDARSVPARSRFNVNVGGLRRYVTTGGVAIDGATVTLTLVTAVAYGETVTVSYGKRANPLRDRVGNEVANFAKRAVTNITPPAGGFWSSKLDVKSVNPHVSAVGCAIAAPCSSALTDDSFTREGTSYRVIQVAHYIFEGVATLALRLDKAIPSGLTLHVGEQTFPIADATLSNSDVLAEWTNHGLSWSAGDKVQLYLSAAASGGGATGNSGPGFQSSSIRGNQLRINFNEPLDEDSAPNGDSFTVGTPPGPGANRGGGRGKRSMQGSGNGPGGTVSGTGPTSVDGATITVTLDRPVPPGWPVTVSYDPPDENPLRDLEGDEAAGFSGRPARSVAPAPAVTAVAVVSDAGSDDTYALGETIRVRVTFGETVNVDTAGGTPRLNIRMDPRWGTFQAAYASGDGTANLIFTYTVAEPNTSPPGIAVLENTLELNGGTIRSKATGADADLAHTGLGHDASHKVNWRLSPPVASAPPGAPTGVTVTGESNTGLSVSWTAPSDTGSAAIAGYELRWYAGASDPANASDWTETGDVGTGTTATIADLTADTAYRVQVRARGAGKGPWSASGAGRTQAAGDTTPPVAESATVNWRAVTVTFDEDLVPVGAGAYLHYYFQVTGGGVQQHPVRATASGRTVTMELGEGSPARAGRSYTIGYSVYSGNGPLKDAAGNAVVEFSGLAAENETQPRLSVADAKAQEGTDASMDFAVTLDAALDEAVTVDYATADGTATAGEDYTAASGTLTFAAGERRKTVSVAILDDAIDEGKETFRLRLSNADGAVIEDGEATGTIINSDAMPRAWLARFGRAAAEHVADAIGERLRASPGTRVTLGGQELDFSASANPDALTAYGGALLTGSDPGLAGGAPLLASANGFGRVLNERTGEDAAAPVRELSMPDLLLASSFHMASAGDGSGSASGRWSVWGRAARSSFEGAEGALTLKGDVTTATLGMDYERGSWLAGVALSRSSGEGSYEKMGMKGEVESGLTGVYPYARYRVSETLALWGVVGFGAGDMTLEPEGTSSIKTDIETGMAAGGARGVLLPARSAGGFELALRADLMATATASDAAANLVETEVETSRLRLLIEASRSFRTGDGSALAASVEAGLRYDGGDAETGSGLEMGGSLRWTSGSFTIEVAARGLMAHSEDDYEEWGVSGSVRYAQSPDGRGFSMRAGSAFGAAAGSAERIWSQRAAGLAGGEFAPGAGLDAEAAYGFGFRGGLLTPYTGVALSDAGDTWRAGARWKLGPAYEVSLEASLREDAAGDDPESGVLLKGSRRW